MLALTKFGHPNCSTPNYGTISYKSITSYPCIYPCVGHVTLVAKCCVAFCCCSVTQLCPTICNPMDCSTPGFPVLHHLPAFAQTHVHWVSDTTQSSHPLSPSPPAPNPSQHQSLFQWVSSLHQVTKVLELQLQHQSFQWIFRVDFL